MHESFLTSLRMSLPERMTMFYAGEVITEGEMCRSDFLLFEYLSGRGVNGLGDEVVARVCNVI